jgi:hypoxanthine phosphoribosyltransferase
LTQLVTPSQYLRNADLIHSQVAVNSAVSKIANQLNLEYTNQQPLVLCVMGGAVYFTGQLLPKLTFALELDYVQATRYQENTSGSDIKWVVMPKENVSNRSVLLLDDILDEGITLKAVADQCYSKGAKDVKVAVLLDKQLSRNKPIKADYVGLSVPNRYVFGCGMDVYGWWRNLPAIYALNDN